MEEFIGTSVAAFTGVTLVLFGGASFMMGQAIGATWRPGWQVVPYGLGIGAANQFLTFALFEGPLLDPVPYLVRTAILIAIALFAYRLTQVQKMVTQYPWLYERAGLLSWRARTS